LSIAIVRSSNGELSHREYNLTVEPGFSYKEDYKNKESYKNKEGYKKNYKKGYKEGYKTDYKDGL